jgi:uncharacterized membrane protein
MSLQASETEIIFRLFFERHKHVLLALAILIVLLAAFTFFQLREIPFHHKPYIPQYQLVS